MKIFLSHSSTDKTIVRKVYEELGAAISYFDEATFDPTGSIPDEIYRTLNESSHFVLFASPAAIASQWVQAELSRAFDSWMRSGIKRVMIFLLDGADVGDLPAWLRQYVMREPPSYRHILCRILSEVDKEAHERTAPPFSRHVELQQLENALLVERDAMPGAILVHGPDGSGRKRLINELYDRQFNFVAPRKLFIAASAFLTEIELYRDVVGLTTIATPSEFADIFKAFERLDHTSRIQWLAKTIADCTEGGQALLVEGDYAIYTEDGSIPEWLAGVISLLAGADYPRLILTGYQRAVRTPLKLLDKLLIQEVPPLGKEPSRILFNWWLKTLRQPYTDSLKDTVFDACSGNPKQLELGAKLLIAEGTGSIAKIKPHLLSTLEGLSRQFLARLADSGLKATVLALVANAGYITRSDLSQYVADTSGVSADDINDAIGVCMSFGFLIEDEVCIRMPSYLVRGARALGRERVVASQLTKIWELQAMSAGKLSLDELTSIPILNEYSLSLLRGGKNVGPVFESIILPSQCLQVARAMYESEQYEETLALCERAYESRAALSQDGLVETLRYMGMAAARLARDEQFTSAAAQLDEVGDSVKAARIANFLRGFKKRLDGKYDEAFKHLNAAYKAQGALDIHVLRELAFVALHTDDIPAARKYIGAALARTGTNQYVIEMAIRVELRAAPAAVAKRSGEIENMLDRLYAFDTSPDKIYWVIARCEYLLALNELQNAEDFFKEKAVSASPVFDMIRAELSMKKKQYSQARMVLDALYERTRALRKGQRQSTLPIICRALVEAASAEQLADGVAKFEGCRAYLPQRVARTLAAQMLEAAAHTRQQLSPSQIALLKNAAQS